MRGEEQDDAIVVHAGFPNPATDKSLEGLDLHQLLVSRPASTFLFRISGNDWEDIGIFDGDIAIVDRALDARPSEPIVWWSNDGHYSISFAKDIPNNTITWGVVTAVIHQFRKRSR